VKTAPGGIQMKPSSMRLVLLSTLLLIILAGCAAFGVPATNDPKEKLSWAYTLMKNGRPLPAERLIKESIDIYSRENNVPMLAESYGLYGLLEYFYPKSKQKPNKTAIENFEKSLKYYDDFFTKNPLNNADPSYAGYYFSASSCAEHLGNSYDPQTDHDQKCRAYAKCLEYNKIGMQIKPEAKINYPERWYKSYQEYVQSKQRAAKCID
jgi:tetratricopeptide (TPR) repeat protein